MLKAYDEVFIPFDALSQADKNNISALTKHPEWSSFEKMMRNQVFKIYKDVLIDEDVSGARKFVTFASSIYKLPKLNSHGVSFNQEENSTNQRGGWDNNNGAIEL